MAEICHREWKQRRLKLYPFVPEWVWEWCEDKYLQGRTMRVVIVAGSRHARKLAEALIDVKRLFKLGFPYPLELKLIFSEDMRDEKQAFAHNGAGRFYHWLSDNRPPRDSRKPLRGKKIDRYTTSAPRWVERTGAKVKVHFVDPCSDEGWDLLHRGVKSGQRPVHLGLGIPWGGWISFRFRQLLGEISLPTSRPVPSQAGSPNPTRFERGLLVVPAPFGLRLTHPLFYGFHPNLRAGGELNFWGMGGAQPFEVFLARKEKKARMAIFSVGPGCMDRPDLWILDGEPNPFGVNYRTWPEEKIVLRMINCTTSWPKWAFLGREEELIKGLAQEIVERFFVLAMADELGMNQYTKYQDVPACYQVPEIPSRFRDPPALPELRPTAH